MERKIKIEYDPKRTYATEFGEAITVGRMTDDDLDILLDSVSKIFISPSGLDSASGLTEASPVRTIAKGIELAVNLDKEAVVFMPGQHSYYASHNLFGKKAIAMKNATFVCIGTVFSEANPNFPSWSGGITPANGFDFIGPTVGTPGGSGLGTWFTGRADQPSLVHKANRFYVPAFSGVTGELRLCRFALYYDSNTAKIATPSVTENEWIVSNAFTTISAYFSANGYPSATFEFSSFPSALRFGPQSCVAMSDGQGRVFLVTGIRMDLAGGTNWRTVYLIWHNGTISYWYETYTTAPTGLDAHYFLNYGDALTAGPAITFGVDPVGGFTQRYAAIQPFKRIGDSGYMYSVDLAGIGFTTDKYRAHAIYYDGVPMFPSFAGDGLVYSAQQISDALQTSGGVYGSLPAWAQTLFGSSQKLLALNLGFRGYTSAQLYNCPADSTQPLAAAVSVNPNSPYMVAPRMLSTNADPSDLDPVFIESAESLSDNLFYGGAAINFKWFAEGDHRTYYGAAEPLTYWIPVHGLGVNCRLQNCEAYLTDGGTSKAAYATGAPVWFNRDRITLTDPKYLEAWIEGTEHDTDPNTDTTDDSQGIQAGDLHRITIGRGPAGDKRLKNSAIVGVFIISEYVRLWHVSAVSCAYAMRDDSLIHACVFAYFSGFYLTPDGSPITIQHSVVREALAQNLIPPGSTVTNCISGDPYVKSFSVPYDLRLQAIAKGDFFDSPALGLSPETSEFGGQREAGAYDDRGQLTITWSEFLIDFPWLMPTESDRMRLTNKRRDGAMTKLSVSANSVRLPLQWQVALSEPDLRNLEKLVNAAESLVRIYFNPVDKPTKYLLGYADQSLRHGGPFGLLSNTSGTVILDVHVKQPNDSLYEYL